MKLGGKVAVVTGAGRGLGRAYALHLAGEGAAVVVNDLPGTPGGGISPAEAVVAEIEAGGGRAVVDSNDVADWEEGSRLISHAVEAFGRIDALVCNAGMVRDGMLFNLTEEDWDSIMRVHLKGHFVPVRAAAAVWRDAAKRSGEPQAASIVLTASSSGLYGNAGQSNYDAAKAGIASFGIAAARELSRYGVRVNVISPTAKTRLTEGLFAESGESMTADIEAFDPANVAPWVTFLCSEAAAEISGQVFGVRGGLVELMTGWTRAAGIHRDGRWTLEELEDRVDDLFQGRDPGPPPLPEFTLK